MFDMSAWTEFKNPEDRTNAGLKLRERFLSPRMPYGACKRSGVT